MKKKAWYEMLLATRRVSLREEPVTSTTVSLESGLDVHIASAWLSKFERWGYVRKVDKVPAGRRWTWRWELTTYGETRGAPERSNQPRVQETLRIAANPSRTRGKTSK